MKFMKFYIIASLVLLSVAAADIANEHDAQLSLKVEQCEACHKSGQDYCIGANKCVTSAQRLCDGTGDHITVSEEWAKAGTEHPAHSMDCADARKPQTGKGKGKFKGKGGKGGKGGKSDERHKGKHHKGKGGEHHKGKYHKRKNHNGNSTEHHKGKGGEHLKGKHHKGKGGEHHKGKHHSGKSIEHHKGKGGEHHKGKHHKGKHHEGKGGEHHKGKHHNGNSTEHHKGKGAEHHKGKHHKGKGGKHHKGKGGEHHKGKHHNGKQEVEENTKEPSAPDSSLEMGPAILDASDEDTYSEEENEEEPEWHHHSHRLFRYLPRFACLVAVVGCLAYQCRCRSVAVDVVSPPVVDSEILPVYKQLAVISKDDDASKCQV